MASLKLPPFLHSLPSREPQEQPWQNAQFVHSRSLGLSHALWWAPRNGGLEPDQVLLFIPGNPGLADFYIPFLSEVHTKHSLSNLAIIAHAHLDHFPGIENKTSRYSSAESLTIQIEASLEVLDTIISSYSKKPTIIVVGHSVGSWIVLQMLKARALEITAAFLLFPTLSHIARTPNGRLLTVCALSHLASKVDSYHTEKKPMFSPISRQILSSLSFLVKYIPEYLFGKLFPGWPEHQILVLRDFLNSPSSIVASLSMAHEEMKMIGDMETGLVECHKDKIWVYYGQYDDWVGEERQSFLNIFDPDSKSTQVVHGPREVPHAFCINHSDTVAKHCCEWLISVSSNRHHELLDCEL